MKPPQFIITVILAAICLILSILVVWQGQSGMSLQLAFSQKQMEVQNQVQERQAKINKGAQTQQVGSNILRDIASEAIDPSGKIKDQKLIDLLHDNGINIKFNQPSPTPAQ